MRSLIVRCICRSVLTTSLGWTLLPIAPPAQAATIHGESVVDVSSDAATLRAQVDPENADTNYTFEYGTDSSYQALDRTSEGKLENGSSFTEVQVHLQDLLPETVYYFRVTTISAGRVTSGENMAFTTQAKGGRFELTDHRGWELVSPPNKFGGGIEPIVEGAIQAAANGSAITYVANGPTEAEPRGNANLTQELSQYHSPGWHAEDIAQSHNAATHLAVGVGGAYRLFAPELTVALVEPFGIDSTPLSPESTEKTIYLRDNTEDSYLPLVTSVNVTSGEKIANSAGESEVHFEGASLDLTHVILDSAIPLTVGKTAGEVKGRGLYEWADGVLEPVSVLPDGSAAEGYPTLGDNRYDVRDAVSNDGARVVWTAGHLYMRDMLKAETIMLDAIEGGVEGGATEPHFEAASTDGSRIFFTDESRLTAFSQAELGKPDLYVFEVTSGNQPLAGTLTDLTEAASTNESGAVRGMVMGVSEDGSYVYFVADGVLTEAENPLGLDATPGRANLYAVHYNIGDSQRWEPIFIASLSGEDSNDWVASGLNLGRMTSKVSPNGRYLAFMSDESLTDYNNRDSVSAEPDEEVFLYDAETKHLICASCNPTAARPNGVFESGEALGPLVDRPALWPNRWLASSIPGWTKVDEAHALYQSRYLLNNGRLFFNSADSLVPQDTNGTEDVYEYEPLNVGNCALSNTTFNGKVEGCVSLISSGTSGDESAFLDASESGEDVFFLTSAKLVPQDYDNAFDVYDAHICSETAPCHSAPVSPPACTTVESCRAGKASELEVFGRPSSAIFSGPGDALPKIAKKKKKKKRKTISRRVEKDKNGSVRKAKKIRKDNLVRGLHR